MKKFRLTMPVVVYVDVDVEAEKDDYQIIGNKIDNLDIIDWKFCEGACEGKKYKLEEMIDNWNKTNKIRSKDYSYYDILDVEEIEN